MVGQIVFEGQTKEGKKYIIRYPDEGDANLMCDYINKISKEKTFISYQGEIVSLEEEAKFLQSQLEKIKNNKTVNLMILYENKVMGISGVDLKERAEGHIGVFGITLTKETRGEGMGKTLMKFILEEAEKNLPQLKLITLSVFANNIIAQNMYKNFGFREYGFLPEGFAHIGQFVDEILMYKKIR